MAIKSSNVTARVEPEVKEQAEAILSSLGIPTSTAITMFYRQIVDDAEFNARMTAGYEQAKDKQSAPSDEVFDRLIGEIENVKVV